MGDHEHALAWMTLGELVGCRAHALFERAPALAAGWSQIEIPGVHRLVEGGPVLAHFVPRSTAPLAHVPLAPARVERQGKPELAHDDVRGLASAGQIAGHRELRGVFAHARYDPERLAASQLRQRRIALS